MDQGRAGDAVLEARVEDAVHAACAGRPHFIGFLNERQAELAVSRMKRLSFGAYRLWGGFPEAERVILGCFPDYMDPAEEEFPLKALTVRFRICDELSHRDFLGALLSRGVVRETLGDILVEPGFAVLFIRKEIAGFLLEQTEKIGKVGVRFDFWKGETLPQAHQFEPFEAVVASLRLDCIVAASTGISREKAAGLISAGMVMLNHKTEISVSAPVAEGNMLSVRGKGRYCLDHAGTVTKKGRLRIEGRKYI